MNQIPDGLFLRGYKLLLLATTTLLIWDCTPIAKVDMVAPKLPAPIPGKSDPSITQATQLDESATKLVQSDPAKSMADSEAAIDLTLQVVKGEKHPDIEEEDGVYLYNYGIARLVEAALNGGAKPWLHEVKIDGPKGPIYVTMVNHSGGAWRPGEDKLIASDRLEIGGTFFTQRTVVDGVGIPLVSKGDGRSEPWAPDKHYYGVTAIAHITGNHCVIEIVDPSETHQVPLSNDVKIVAADYSAPMALSISETQPQKFGIMALLRTDQFMQAEKMIMTEPYRPNRQPLILIHGLIDSPTTWAPMINALNANPAIREKYEIWTYRYL